MTKIGIFKITGSFKLTNRGLVVLGDIVEGKVKIDSYITFNTDTANLTMRISAVEYADSLSRKEFKIGLMFSYKDEQEMKTFEALSLKEQMCEIKDDL